MNDEVLIYQPFIPDIQLKYPGVDFKNTLTSMLPEKQWMPTSQPDIKDAIVKLSIEYPDELPNEQPTIYNDKLALRAFIKSWEGNYANVKNDKGGPTNMGVTIGTWKSIGYDKNGDGKITASDVKLLTDEDMEMVFTKLFWNTCKADQIKDPNIANILVDWMWGSGYAGISRARKALGLPAGKTVDLLMLNVLNSGDPRIIFEKLKSARILHFHDIVSRDKSQAKFLKGWLRRVNNINYNSLKGGDNKEYFK